MSPTSYQLLHPAILDCKVKVFFHSFKGFFFIKKRLSQAKDWATT